MDREERKGREGTRGLYLNSLASATEESIQAGSWEVAQPACAYSKKFLHCDRSKTGTLGGSPCSGLRQARVPAKDFARRQRNIPTGSGIGVRKGLGDGAIQDDRLRAAGRCCPIASLIFQGRGGQDFFLRRMAAYHPD